MPYGIIIISVIKMIYIKDTIPEVTKKFGKREITHVFHDIDGTHSLIRDWPPVMSIVLHYVSENGVPEGYDSDEQVKKLVDRVDAKTNTVPRISVVDSAPAVTFDGHKRVTQN